MSILNISLKGSVAVVTGAAGIRGIGRAIALNLAAAGADVAVCDMKVKDEYYDLEDTAAQIRKLGRRALASKVDVSSESDVTDFFQKTVKELGRIDILINNAGILGNTPLLEMTARLWDRVMEVNLKGVLLCSQAAARIMIPAKSGAIVNIASSAGMRGAPPNSAYGTSKAGVIHMTRWLAQELAPHGIRVNAIAPGIVVTDLYSDVDPQKLEKEFAEIRKHIPLGKFGEPSDVADLAVFLACDASRYITGQSIVVDGGLVLY